MRNPLELGRYYGTNTCGKEMNLIIRDVVSDEYNYTVPRLIASTAAIKTVFVLPLDCARTRARIVDGYVISTRARIYKHFTT